MFLAVASFPVDTVKIDGTTLIDEFRIIRTSGSDAAPKRPSALAGACDVGLSWEHA
jgi:hypothetical protein